MELHFYCYLYRGKGRDKILISVFDETVHFYFANSKISKSRGNFAKYFICFTFSNFAKYIFFFLGTAK